MNENTGGISLYEGAAKPLETEINGIPVIVAPDDWTVHELENCLDSPPRVQAQMDVSCLESFIRYVNAHKEPGTIIKLKNSGGSQINAVAIIDYHNAPESPGENENFANWQDHQVHFNTRSTGSWDVWSSNNNQMLSQSKFADFIYQNKPEVIEPSGAELLEIITTLKALSKGVFKNMIDHHDGSIDMVMNVKVSTQGGTTDRPLQLPKQIKVKLKAFYGGPELELTADLVVRVPKEDGDPVLFGYRFYRLADELEDMSESVEKQLTDETKLPVYRCK